MPLDGIHGVIMSRMIIIVVFGALLITCIGAQVISMNDTESNQVLTQ